MENMLKGATRETIQTLNDCKIRTIMATGDNTLTAISVARHCNILQPDQEIFIGDVENEKVVWRSTDESKPPLNYVPSIDEPCGLALNGNTLQFLCKNKD
jgi:cation-transporting ATPase 13A3/4/5